MREKKLKQLLKNPPPAKKKKKNPLKNPKNMFPFIKILSRSDQTFQDPRRKIIPFMWTFRLTGSFNTMCLGKTSVNKCF